MLMTDIHVRTFTGQGLKAYIHSMAKLRLEVFKDFPYYEEPDLDLELKYLRKILADKESIGVLIFDNTTLVGVSIGCPLYLENSIHKPFLERGQDIKAFYYFGDSALLKNYRGRGIGHHFFDARESHVAQFKKYKHICFCIPNDLRSDGKALESTSLHDFWRKRGYCLHPDLRCSLIWRKIGQAHPTEHPMSIWTKDI